MHRQSRARHRVGVASPCVLSRAPQRRRSDRKEWVVFAGIIAVKVKGVAHLSYQLMNQYTGLRGLEEAMIDMYTAPQMLHDAMAFFEQGHRRVLEQYVSQNLLSLNSDSTYQNSGGNGYTHELPAPGFCANRVRPCDMWASAESQEMAQVGPKQHAEFALPYEKRLLEPFGLTGYGCCEDLTLKLDDASPFLTSGASRSRRLPTSIGAHPDSRVSTSFRGSHARPTWSGTWTNRGSAAIFATPLR